MDVGLYRCKDCFAPDLLCQACIIYAHAHSPVHRVEVSVFLDRDAAHD
jgi:hypothetical protein